MKSLQISEIKKLSQWNVQYSHFLKWFISYNVMALCFRNVPWLGKFWNISGSTRQLYIFHCHFVSERFCLAVHITPQTWSCICPVFQLSSFKTCHLTGLWVQSSSWEGLRMRLPCAHFQQILNQNQIKFCVVNLATTECYCYLLRLHPRGGKIICPLPCSPTKWMAITPLSMQHMCWL